MGAADAAGGLDLGSWLLGRGQFAEGLLQCHQAVEYRGENLLGGVWPRLKFALVVAHGVRSRITPRGCHSHRAPFDRRF